MSNQIYLVKTTFTDHSGSCNGFRMYDNYDKTYNNMADMLDIVLPDGNLEFLGCILENFMSDDMAIQTMIDFIKEEAKGIEINGTYYDYEEIKELL